MKYFLMFVLAGCSLCATPEYRHQLLRTGTFMGDSQGNYRGDKLLIFVDGSHWKVHPHDHSKCFHWQSSDTLTIHKRPYYLRRWEHPFTVVNVSLDEKVRAMPIQHADNPLTVVDMRPSDHCGYKTVVLSDGTRWDLLFNRYPFTAGEKVYVAENENSFRTHILIVNTGSQSQGFEAHLAGD